MRTDYDAASDIAYIYLRDVDPDEWKHTVPTVEESINLDFDERRRLTRIEIHSASQRLPHEFLATARWLRESAQT